MHELYWTSRRSLKKLIDAAQDAPNTVILAEDEASLYLQATTMAGWEPRGQPLVVACDPSRTKTNFYGTLTMKTGQEIVTEAATMNAAATTTHLRAILAAHPDVPVLLLPDRAPWHRGAEIRRYSTRTHAWN
ncbi:MAG: transposase [Chloroflexota bacterium]|nr:transposase [Chloroflexota bacterium]